MLMNKHAIANEKKSITKNLPGNNRNIVTKIYMPYKAYGGD